MWSAQNFETKLSGDFSNSLKSNAINTSKFSTFPTELSQRTCMSVRPLRSERPRGAQRKPVTSTQKQIVFVTPATQPLLITKALSLTQHLLLKLAGMSEWANSNKSCQRSKKKRKKKVVWRPTALISKRDHYLIRAFTTSWFPFLISHALWNDLSVPTLFVASIVPILLVLDSCNGLTAETQTLPAAQTLYSSYSALLIGCDVLKVAPHSCTDIHFTMAVWHIWLHLSGSVL